MEAIQKFFHPASVAVIGASRNPEKLGYGVARNLIGSGYQGEIFLVNPKGGNLFGHELIKSIEDLQDGIDLGLVVVPPSVVPNTLAACSHKGIKNIIILTGGFSEVGPAGKGLEDKVRDIIRSEHLSVIGPNCIGILDTHLPIDTTFIQPPMPSAGEVGFITHSGALGAAMIDWSKGEGFGFSRVVSLGNQVDITETDMLLPVAEMVDTKVVVMYLESISKGPEFIDKASGATQLKPVIALKAGRSDAGKKAAASHTGAMAGSEEAVDAAFRRAGILRASSTEEMFSWAKLFSGSPMPEGGRLAILTNAGGPGVTAADAVSAAGLAMADFSDQTFETLTNILPPAASVANPIDMLASASPGIYSACLEVLISDPGVDMILVIAPPPPMFDAVDIAEALTPVIERSIKPVVVSFMGSPLVAEAVNVLRSEKIPEYTFPEDGISALGAAWRYVQYKDQEATKLEYRAAKEQIMKVANYLSSSVVQDDFVNPDVVNQIMATYNLPVIDLHYAVNAMDAIAIADDIGYPVAMKLALPGISHKSDLGGVLLGLDTPERVQSGIDLLKRRIENLAGKDQMAFGVHIQKMAPKGQELIVGVVRDQVFGPMVMFGAGGTEVEGLGDVEFAIAPLTDMDLDYLIEHTWAGRRLKGYRQYAPADRLAVRDVVIKLAQLLVDHPEIKEIEANPLIALPEGQGCCLVDARMVLESGS